MSHGDSSAAVHGTDIELFSLGGHDGFLREVNDTFARLLGMIPAEINGLSLLELVHPEDIEEIVKGLGALEAGAQEVLLDNRFLQRDGHFVHLQWVARPMPGTDLWWASGRDTTHVHRLLAERVDLRTRLDLALGQATAAMWEFGCADDTFAWEAQAVDVLGVAVERLPLNTADLVALAHPDDQAGVLAALQALSQLGTAEVGMRVGRGDDVRHLSLRGRVLDRDRRGRARRAVGLLLDVSTEKAMEEQMLRMIMSDALTGAPNRRAFDQALRGEWRRAKRALEPLSVLAIDIDNFKSFNDTFGHLVGDEALCAVARALATAIHREGDLLARFGGEEFAVVLPGADTVGAMAMAQRMLEAVREVVLRQADGRSITVSIGTASWHPDGSVTKAADVLLRADQALYAAKSAGKNQAVTYECSLAASDALLTDMAAGLAAREFALYYQPVIALADGHIAGFEALMRWNRPGIGLVPPDDFIPAAEATTLICDMGRWALQEAACQLASWTLEGLDPDRQWRMAVNASGRHVSDPAILDDVRSALAVSGIPPSQLEVELTESALVNDVLADVHLAALRQLGVTVAIDDFGTGYTSVGQLPHLPVDTLKIDRSFVAATEDRQRALVGLMIAAGHSFDLRVVAEGIEDAATYQLLRQLGCDDAQGYFMARPMPASQIAAWVADWRSRAQTHDADNAELLGL